MALMAKRLDHPAISITATLAIFFSLWLLDFPKPMFDDLFYTGAAMNMEKGGDFSNPLLARQGFPGHYFFVYPPLHSYALAGWLKIFGISSWSMTGFAILLMAIISIATIITLRRHNAGIWLELAVPFGAAFAMLPLGLRPDTIGITLTMAGFALADWKRNPGAPLACGFLLMFLGASVTPRVTLFAIALAACTGYQAWRLPATAHEKWRMLGLILGAGFLTGLVFLSMIHFRLGEFLTTFKFHSTRFAEIGDTRMRLFAAFVKSYLRILNWPLVLIPAGLIVYLWRKPKNSLSVAGICAFATFPVAAAAGLVWLGALWWMIVAMLFLGVSALRIASQRVRIGLTIAIVGILVLANRRDYINVAGILSGKITADLGEGCAAALSLHPSPERGLLIDSWVARYLYNYRLPEGALDLDFGAPFPGSIPGYGLLPHGKGSGVRTGDVYLAGPRVVSILARFTYLERSIPMWSPFGISRLVMEKDPRHVYVIGAESCENLREKPLP